VGTNPEPDEVVAITDAEGAIVKTDESATVTPETLCEIARSYAIS